MTSLQKSILGFLSLLACMLIGFVGYYGFQAYHFYAAKPLGPALPASTAYPPPWTATAGGPLGATTLVPTKSFATNTPQPLCGGPNVMTVLAIGTDQRSDSYQYGLGDVIRVVRVDFATPKVTVLEFLRDLWVKIPYISDNLNGLDHGKLNQAYLFGNPGDGFHYWDDPSQGPGLLSLTLNLNFGVNADHYVAVNMRTFEKIVDAVDGIDINITNQKQADDAALPIGTHHLDGPNALKVARNRVNGDFARGTNQNLVLCALRKKLLNPTVVTKIPDLIASFQNSVQTDFTPEQLSQLACLGTKLPTENIVFASFPKELFTLTRIPDPYFHNPKGASVYDVDFNILRDYVARFNAGTWPPPSSSKEETSSSYCP